MPRGPRGEKRPADAVARAVMVAKIATGELEETSSPEAKVRAGREGAKTRAAKLTPEQRKEISRVASNARWKKT